MTPEQRAALTRALLAKKPQPTIVFGAQPDLVEAIEESIEERAAIREFDGGEDRETAEREARAGMSVYDVHVTMPDERAPRWVTMIAPGCDLAQAQLAAESQFSASRVISVREHQPERVKK